MKNNTTYDVTDLTSLEKLEPVRVRPGMYIGSIGSKGLHHCVWEILDNAIDEISNGYGNKAQVILNKDKSVTVIDNGRGIPTGIHPVKKKSGVEMVFTELHTGGKFDNKNYKTSGGLHGVGAAVVNALSKWLEVGNKVLSNIETDLDNDKIMSLMKDTVFLGTADVKQLQIPMEGYFKTSSDGAYLLSTNSSETDWSTNADILKNFIFKYNGKGEFKYGK